MDGSVHILCPHCDTINRLPRDRLKGGGRCGQCHQALFDAHPVALDTARFERHLAKSDVPLLIDFWASWCGPCQAMAPEFERAAAALEPEVRLVKVNVDEEPVLAQKFQVRSIPTLVLALHGRELARSAGARSAAQLVEWVRRELAVQT
ncbi:MAG: thioredoxin TrxC [Alphaproteobacteria bacterium]|nr:MAG: thioredoxin TrxC [Alphaproteobacteria bacterium]